MAAIDGKHGNPGFHIRTVHRKNGERIELHKDVYVRIHDNSPHGLNIDELRKVADQSILQPIYWNDRDSYYWMFDFKVCGHWCEMLHEDRTGESIFECMHINVYS